MFLHKVEKKVFFVCLFSLVVAAAGCDKIPFLAQYFPSKKETKPASQPASPSVPLVSAAPVELPTNVLARVGNWTMTLDEFNEKLKALKEVIPDYDTNDPEAKKTILEELIRQQLLIQDAEKNGIAKKKDILDAVEEFRRTLIVREMASKLTEGMETTDAEAQDYFNQNKSAFVKPGEWHIREIMLSTQEEAKEIQIELLKGADFAATAQTRSKSESAAKGGDLGSISEFKFPQMETAVSTLSVGELSSVFKGPDGYYIVKLEEKKGGEPLIFDEVKEEIKAGLTLLKQQQKILSYIEELKAKANIQINESLIQ